MNPILLVFLFIIPSSSSTFPIAKPGCEHQALCGTVIIPFPFGTRKGCYLHERFLIKCNDSIAYLQNSNYVVRYISLQGQLRVLDQVEYDCYSPNDDSRSNYSRQVKSIGTPMVFNSTGNRLVAIGCDTFAAIINGYGHRRIFTTGCMSICDNKDYVSDGACSGVGCCQTFIPPGIFFIKVTLSSYYNHSGVSDFNPCSYAFVVEEEAFQLFAGNLTNIDTDTHVPVLVDWTAEYNVTCEDAIKNATSYLCLDRNSVCWDDDGAIGYRCRCQYGFEGNPYIANGCRDIDECKSPSLNDCGGNYTRSTCNNTMGGYECLCDYGYHWTADHPIQGYCVRDHPHKSAYLIILPAGVASVLGVLCLMVSTKMIKKWRKKKQKERFFKRNGGLLLQGQLSNNEELVQRTKIFSAKELNKASDGFNVNRILGQGGQGTVYKGMLTDGRIIAIKKSKGVEERELVQFINEVIILSQVIHKNVVKLLGCCLETEVPLLVYEFIPNGTLFSLIHNVNEDQDFPLTWSIRLRIAQEVASALAYLHSSISTPIFHKDIKSLNILMDEKYRAKVSDFGASRSVEVDKTHLTTRVQGTFGYIDPEFFQSNQFTDKSDVYSFGVVLIELLTRKKLISSSRDDLGLVTRFLECMQKGCLRSFLDAEILTESTAEEALSVAKLAGRCVHLNGRRRPTMKEVAGELENIKKSNQLDIAVHQKHSQSSSYAEEEYGDMSTFTSTRSDSFPLLINDTM